MPASAVTSGLAVDYTDTWYTVGEEGWGITLFQSDTVIYAIFFIYGPDKKPTWMNAVTSWDGTSKYTGNVFTYQGTYFPSPWNPADTAGSEMQVGTATFEPDPNNASLGTLTYTITGVGTVTKAIQRLTLTTIPVSGAYTGGQSGAYTGCTNSADNSLYTDTFSVQISQSGSTTNLAFFYNGLNEGCSFVGTMTQNGPLHFIPSATYKCDDGLNTMASVSDLKITAQGIEGRYSAPDVGGGCREDARFSAAHN